MKRRSGNWGQPQLRTPVQWLGAATSSDGWGVAFAGTVLTEEVQLARRRRVSTSCEIQRAVRRGVGRARGRPRFWWPSLPMSLLLDADGTGLARGNAGGNSAGTPRTASGAGGAPRNDGGSTHRHVRRGSPPAASDLHRSTGARLQVRMLPRPHRPVMTFL